jgi:hypothetical protein
MPLNITPDMSPEEIKAQLDALPLEEKKEMARRVVATVQSMVFDVLAMHRIAQNNGRTMPTEEDFCQALANSNQATVH